MTNFEIQLDIPNIEIERVETNTKGDILIYLNVARNQNDLQENSM